MEYGTIEREIHIDAVPDVVFDVVTTPEHIRHWWGAEAELDPAPDTSGELVWGDRDAPDGHVVPISVVRAERPTLFSFRWLGCGGGEAMASGNSLLVTFELTPVGDGTRLRVTEGGFRELGWEAAKLEALYAEHVTGWDRHVADLGEYLARLAPAS